MAGVAVKTCRCAAVQTCTILVLSAFRLASEHQSNRRGERDQEDRFILGRLWHVLSHEHPDASTFLVLLFVSFLLFVFSFLFFLFL